MISNSSISSANTIDENVQDFIGTQFGQMLEHPASGFQLNIAPTPHVTGRLPTDARLMIPHADVIPPTIRPNFAELRSSLNRTFGIRLQSTGNTGDNRTSKIIFETFGVSPNIFPGERSKPCFLTFDQHILTPFTGASGKFELVECDSIRQVYDGSGLGMLLNSATMNFKAGDTGKFITVGRYPGQTNSYTIWSRQSSTQVTLTGNLSFSGSGRSPTAPLRSRATPLSGSGLFLTMEGENKTTIATHSGFIDGSTMGNWSRLTKVNTVDKTYTVNFFPGGFGDGVYTISARPLDFVNLQEEIV